MYNYTWDIIFWIEVCFYIAALLAFLTHVKRFVDQKQKIDYSNIACFVFILLSVLTKLICTTACLIGIESQGLSLLQYGAMYPNQTGPIWNSLVRISYIMSAEFQLLALIINSNRWLRLIFYFKQSCSQSNELLSTWISINFIGSLIIISVLFTVNMAMVISQVNPVGIYKNIQLGVYFATKTIDLLNLCINLYCVYFFMNFKKHILEEEAYT